jgi:methylthioribose-1-phosphate isomerase
VTPRPGPAPEPPATIVWNDGAVRIIDQTLLPGEFVHKDLRTVEEVAEAIRMLRVRGAPAIGIAGAMGVALGARLSEAKDWDRFGPEMDRVISDLAATRPTAVNLFWALERMRGVLEAAKAGTVADARRTLLAEAQEILEEDRRLCRAIGRHGSDLLADGATVLTHCNAGGLATADYGTALAVIFDAVERGKRVRVYADETRPLLQGARLTAWELSQRGIPVTVIVDGASAWTLKTKGVDAVIVGSDRIAANGDVANKVGTYGVAIQAARHGVPFYVAAPLSTVDFDLESGDLIPIEERGAEEITEGFGRRTAPEGVETFNPAFDVTPHELVAAFITDRGVARPPFRESLAALRAMGPPGPEGGAEGGGPP